MVMASRKSFWDIPLAQEGVGTTWSHGRPCNRRFMRITQWHHHAITYDGEKGVYYFDGQE